MNYLPSSDINSQYRYQIKENSIKVFTNMTKPYDNNLIVCYEILPHMNYLKTNDDYCTITEKNNANLDYNSFTNDFWYRIDLSNILIIFLVLFIFCIYMPYRIISRWFGRWLKV